VWLISFFCHQNWNDEPMSDSIDRETAMQVARLARIHLSAAEADSVPQQLSHILHYVGQLNQVDLPDDIEPFFGAVESVNAIRPDKVDESFDRDLMLENAPDTDGEFYRVPPVFK
jgi:aspartyl-tRNA(Asn)/glutamyl-tRNA(Gln) amidotransferase subunit C